jgi:hypothetical protein
MASFNRYASLVKSQTPETIEQLERYARLLRLGNFDGANSLWGSHLIHRSNSFLVVVCRAEGLLRQSAYGKANEFLDSVLEPWTNQPDHPFTSSEMKLLSLIHAICEIFTKGLLRRALIEARITRDWLSTTDYWEYDAVQVKHASLSISSFADG